MFRDMPAPLQADLLFVLAAAVAIMGHAQGGRMPRLGTHDTALNPRSRKTTLIMLCSTLRLYAEDDAPVPPPVVSFQVVRSRAVADPLRPAIARARQALLGRQQPDGRFAESQAIDPPALAVLALAKAFVEPRKPGQFRQEMRGLLAAQRADGGWSATGSGPLDMSSSILAYFALKLGGQSPASEPMVCARRAILSRGGLTQIDHDTRIWLALFGQFPFDALQLPALESRWLRKFFRFRTENAGRSLSTAARLCHNILAALRPRRHIPGACGVRELCVTPPAESNRPGRVLGHWRRRRLPLRRPALDAARRELMEVVGAWANAGGASPPRLQDMALVLVTLDCLGYTTDTAPRRSMEELLGRLVDRESDVPRQRVAGDAVQAEVIAALRASGLKAEHHGLQGAARWLSRTQPFSVADAALRLISAADPQRDRQADDMLPPSLQIGADDLDDPVPTDVAGWECDEARLRGMIRDAQRADGSWSHSPQYSDITTTAIALFALALDQRDPSPLAVSRAIDWLRGGQQADGSWPASQGEQALTVTSRVMRAMTAAGVDETDASVVAAGEWLLAHQQSGGGWGDAEPGDPNALAGEGWPTPRQTAAALAGLLAAGQGASEAASRGLDYLMAQQRADGQWASAQSAAEHEAAISDAPLLETAEVLWALAQYAAHFSQPRPARAMVHRPPRPALHIAPWSYEAG